MKQQASYIGIDYGNGYTNCDISNGIRYGVISLNNVSQEFLNDFEAIYPETENGEHDDYLEPYRENTYHLSSRREILGTFLSRELVSYL